jgi:hypothetical protein
LRDLPGFGVGDRIRINAFIRQWADAGVVTPQAGPEDGTPFPDAFWVELGHALFNDSATAPHIDPPVSPTAGDLAGPVGAAIPTPES